MKTPEEYIEKVHNASNNIAIFDTNTYVFICDAKKYIEQAQKDAYNQALEDAAEYAEVKTGLVGHIVIDKQSILKLKKQ